MPLSRCGLKFAEGWEEIVNIVFLGDTLMSLTNGVILIVDFLEQYIFLPCYRTLSAHRDDYLQRWVSGHVTKYRSCCPPLKKSLLKR